MDLNPEELVFACAVIRRKRDVLIVRPRGQDESVKWIFPADRVRPEDASPESACRRMAEEKLGARLAIDFGQPPLRDEMGGQATTYRYFFGHLEDDDVKNLDFAEIRWVNLAQLREYEFDPASQMVADWLEKNG